MPKTLSPTWVKNVYSLRKAQGIKSGLLYTVPTLSFQNNPSPVHNSLALPRFIPVFYTQLSTLFFSYFNLLINQLYPFSTEPITKRTKED